MGVLSALKLEGEGVVAEGQSSSSILRYLERSLIPYFMFVISFYSITIEKDHANSKLYFLLNSILTLGVPLRLFFRFEHRYGTVSKALQ